MIDPILSFTTTCRRPGQALGPCMTSGEQKHAEDYARYLVKECHDDPRTITVTIDGLCGECTGNGKRAKRRGGKIVAFAWLPCKACNGEGRVEVATYNPLLEGEPA